MHQKELSRALDWLDVVHPAPVPVGMEPRTPRCGEVGEQAWRRTGGPVRGERGERGSGRGGSAAGKRGSDPDWQVPCENGCARISTPSARTVRRSKRRWNG